MDQAAAESRTRSFAGFVAAMTRRGVITDEHLSRFTVAAERDRATVSTLEKLGLLEPRILTAELSNYFGIKQLDEGEWPLKLLHGDRLSSRFMREKRVLPVRAESGELIVAVSDPTDEATLKALQIATGMRVQMRLAGSDRILAQIERLTAKGNGDPDNPAWVPNAANDDDDTSRDLALEAPVIDYVYRLFREAAASRATDLHIEPARGNIVVRRRIDGMLGEVDRISIQFGRAVVSRIKILSNLNIAERRLPQDGRSRLRMGDRDYDVRIGTMPTVHGEGLAIRFLSSAQDVPQIGQLGLSERDERLIRQQIASPNGLIAVTGPTGSGKTTTLAALLGQLNDPTRKIVTIEDPVEYQIDGVNQVQVKADIGLSFSNTLRSLLRFDPDIIMVGEMRDSETARIGVHAALTGHLVLTTLHTNSAAGAISRLLDLDVQGYLVASTLRCVIAQRLVRKLCTVCREPYDTIPEELRHGNSSMAEGLATVRTLFRAKGCERCNGTGYYGRVAIFDVLMVDDEIRKLIKPNVPESAIAALARERGMTTMVTDGLAKCQAGITTVEEIGRVALEE